MDILLTLLGLMDISYGSTSHEFFRTPISIIAFITPLSHLFSLSFSTNLLYSHHNFISSCPTHKVIHTFSSRCSSSSLFLSWVPSPSLSSVLHPLRSPHQASRIPTLIRREQAPTLPSLPAARKYLSLVLKTSFPPATPLNSLHPPPDTARVEPSALRVPAAIPPPLPHCTRTLS